MQKADILNILKTDKTVFSFRDIMLASSEDNPALLRRRLHYYIKHNQLYHIRRGLYAKNKNYNRLELATKIFTPSYVSFETVLIKAGIIFQHYGQIFVASYQSKEVTCDNQTFVFKKVKNNILTNDAGVEDKGNYWIASQERAFLDIVYLHKEYHFDNLPPLDWDKVFTILPIYSNKQMAKRVDKYYQGFKNRDLK